MLSTGIEVKTPLSGRSGVLQTITKIFSEKTDTDHFPFTRQANTLRQGHIDTYTRDNKMDAAIAKALHRKAPFCMSKFVAPNVALSFTGKDKPCFQIIMSSDLDGPGTWDADKNRFVKHYPAKDYGKATQQK